MSFATLYTRACVGIAAPLVTVEVHLSRGLPSFSIVGLPEKSINESKERIRSALINSGFEFPAKRITLNLAPADLRKHGSHYDLAIALGILIADKQLLAPTLADYEFAGELALSGELRGVAGCLPLAIQTRKAQRALLVAKANAEEAALVDGLPVFGAIHLLEVAAHLSGGQALQAESRNEQTCTQQYPDLQDVIGQPTARRALEIAACGGHNLLLSGPPGSGKTLLAHRLLSILPELKTDEALEVAAIYSLGGINIKPDNWRKRPFRTPHHGASSVALVGGGSRPAPGEISLAHCGVLFLDELPEFGRCILDNLREPLESGSICISRAAGRLSFPARFQLIAAMNPCPCGYYGDPESHCRCSEDQVNRYRGRLSGPLLDRIDLHVTVGRVPLSLLIEQEHKAPESSEPVRARVLQARQTQQLRRHKTNSQLSNAEIKQDCHLDKACRLYLEKTLNSLKLSARAYQRTLKVARSIADLAQSPVITQAHLSEAILLQRQP